jgi:hypothetical protein
LKREITLPIKTPSSSHNFSLLQDISYNSPFFGLGRALKLQALLPLDVLLLISILKDRFQLKEGVPKLTSTLGGI